MDVNKVRVEEDQDLVDRILAGDREAFRVLVEKHHERVFRLVRGIVGDWHRTEDVCQEVFVLVYRKLSSFRRDSKLSTWIYRVAVNAAIRARRRWAPRLPDPGTVHLREGNEDPNPSFEGEEVVKKLLAPLPAKLRAIVLLREEVGLGYDEIARVLGCSRGAVEQRLHRAMEALREIWKGRGGEP